MTKASRLHLQGPSRYLFLCLLPLLLIGCARNPATGERDFVLISESREIEIGREMHEKILAGMPIYDDEELAAYVDEVGQRVAQSADRPDLTYTFTIIDSPDINAFALPGGYVYINRGLLAYLQTEAQMAAVLAHEIGHITARHGVRRDTAQKGAGIGTGILSVLSVLTTGTNVMGDVASLYASAAVMGYGREMELEADRFGARYLYNAGYDPEAMVEVIGVLKNHERFMRMKARDQGQKRQTYHGVFSSHPRNDQRLRQVVGEASQLVKEGERDDHAERFRRHTQDLVFGENVEAAVAARAPDPRRYMHQRLGFTLLFPEGWEAENHRDSIVATPADGSADLTLRVELLRSNIGPSEYIRRELGIPLLNRSQPISQYGLIGHTGLRPASGDAQAQRVAVLYQGNRVYVLTGSIHQPAPDTDYDGLFMESIRSFQPLRVTGGPRSNQRVQWVRANENTTFAALARLSSIRPYPEEELRVMNDYYPSGEPKPGEWIKIVK